jgi:hypothetical protein
VAAWRVKVTYIISIPTAQRIAAQAAGESKMAVSRVTWLSTKTGGVAVGELGDAASQRREAAQPSRKSNVAIMFLTV